MWETSISRCVHIQVCREFIRGACKRAETECRFAHPLESVSSHEDGSVTVCMDAVKGRCARDPCRYFHPPLHLQAQIKAAQTRATAVWLFNPKSKIKKKKTNNQTTNTKQRFWFSLFIYFVRFELWLILIKFFFYIIFRFCFIKNRLFVKNLIRNIFINTCKIDTDHFLLSAPTHTSDPHPFPIYKC